MACVSSSHLVTEIGRSGQTQREWKKVMEKAMGSFTIHFRQTPDCGFMIISTAQKVAAGTAVGLLSDVALIQSLTCSSVPRIRESS